MFLAPTVAIYWLATSDGRNYTYSCILAGESRLAWEGLHSSSLAGVTRHPNDD
jgi:hypothetical protein